MMTESVSVTVQSGNSQPTANNQPSNKGFLGGLNLNALYFRTIPGMIKLLQVGEIEVERKDKESTSELKDRDEEDEPERTEEEIQREKKRRLQWEKLTDFLKTHTDKMIDTISFNASTNLYRNDVANLSSDNWLAMFADPQRDYESRVSLIDLKTTANRFLFSMSWHCELDDILACAYLDRYAKDVSLIALWSLDTPLKPKMILKCEERVSIVTFCPLVDYTDVIVGGCLDGTIVLWEINRQILITNVEEPESKEAKVATSAEKAQKLSITSIQWLPFWCRIATDGNFQKIPVDSPRGKTSCFATSSSDGTIFFWNLPKSLSTPAIARSPLHLTISPIYQLILEKTGEKVATRIPISSFLLPLAKNEESSSLSIRDQADLERLRKVFIGTCHGEILYCGWESQTFAVDVTDKEVCKVIHKCEIHDGIVRCMTKSAHLDDVFLSVGGRVFAIWKEDFPRAPIFHRRSKEGRYGEGCWSARSGMFVLARLDGCFEVWDLKRKADEPVLLQNLSEKVTPYISSSPLTYRQKLLSLLDGASTVRIFVEPNEEVKDEDLERVEWFEEFVWRETTRKLDFHRWQDEYLTKNPVAIQRKQEREQAEVNRRHQEARERFLKVLGIICMALAGHGWFLFVAVAAFIMTIIWCVVYLFSIRESLNIPINWIMTEMSNTGIWTVLYFTAFIVQFTASYPSGAHIAGGVFGIFNTLAYAAGTYFLYLEYKN